MTKRLICRKLTRRRNGINRRILIIIAIIFSVFVSAYFSVNLYYLLSNNIGKMLNLDIKAITDTIITNVKVLKMFLIVETIIISFLLLFSRKTKNIYHSEEVQLTDKIKVPKPIGEGQHRNRMVVK